VAARKPLFADVQGLYPVEKHRRLIQGIEHDGDTPATVGLKTSMDGPGCRVESGEEEGPA